jgi:diadenosine tetraphosphate (Ap4A) HIT family hydrolase
MSPLTTGHLLLLPVRHYLSFAQVLGVHTTEAVDLINRVTALYTETFQTPLIMEHGSSGGQESHACITHAHLHFLPADGGIVDRFLIDDELAYRELDSITELSQAPWPHSAYFLRIYGDSCRVYLPTTAQKRQYLRSAAGEALAIKDPEWDYAVVMRMTELRSTMNMVGHWSDVLNRTALNTEVTGGE